MSGAPSSTRRLPPGFQELARSELGRLFGSVLRLRLTAVPGFLIAALLLAALEDVSWRWLVLGGLPAVVLGLSVLEVRRFERRGMVELAVELNLLLAVVVQLVASFATGGVESPLMPLVLLLACVWSLLVTGRPWYDGTVAALQLAAPWLFVAVAVGAWLPDYNLRLFGGGPRGGHGAAHLATSAALLNASTLVARAVGRRLRRVLDALLARALEANEASRREHAERSSALAALTSGVAHELKNPLASVKGLAALLAQSVVSGKEAERLSVLRREVDRMGEVLDEFLDFSRPLVPLSLEDVELGDVCRDVVRLHEGVALARGLRLGVAGSVRARCDARKLRQVLVNLVQNAIEASPPHATIEVRCEREGASRAVVRVLDRGSGLSEAVRARLFEPGVTSKPSGHGLGLVVARSLVRQHGGELLLEPRVGGGCEARLEVPVSPASGDSEDDCAGDATRPELSGRLDGRQGVEARASAARGDEA